MLLGMLSATPTEDESTYRAAPLSLYSRMKKFAYFVFYHFHGYFQEVICRFSVMFFCEEYSRLQQQCACGLWNDARLERGGPG